LQEARAACSEIHGRGQRVLFVGGTPLYLKALLRGLFNGPAADRALRQRLTEEANAVGVPALHQRLAHIDPVTAERVHPNDLRRIIRALEVWEVSGRPISSWQSQWSLAGAPVPAAVWLDLPRQELYLRIDRRVEQMFRDGLADEVRRLRTLEPPLSREARQALGYKEVFEHLEGLRNYDDTLRLVQQRSRNFAKRQISWFRHLPECRPISRELTATLWESTIEQRT